MKIVYKIIFGIFGGFNGSYDPKYLASLVFGEVSLVEFLDLIFDYKNNNDIVTVICLMILAALYTEGAYFEVYAVTDGEKANKSSPLKIYNTALTVRNETDPSKYNIEAKAKIFEFENEFFCVSGRYGCKDGLVFDFGENASLTSSTDEDSSSSTNTSSETEENSEEETIKITCPTNVYKGNSIWISPGTLDDEIEAKWNLDKGYCKLNTRKNGIYIATWENYLKPKAPDTSELFDTSLFEFTSKLDNSYVRYFKKIGEKYYFDWVKTLIGVSDASGLTFAKSINDNNGRLSEISDSIKYEYIPFYKI
jgi:hypothetical protein